MWFFFYLPDHITVKSFLCIYGGWVVETICHHLKPTGQGPCGGKGNTVICKLENLERWDCGAICIVEFRQFPSDPSFSTQGTWPSVIRTKGCLVLSMRFPGSQLLLEKEHWWKDKQPVLGSWGCSSTKLAELSPLFPPCFGNLWEVIAHACDFPGELLVWEVAESI